MRAGEKRSPPRGCQRTPKPALSDWLGVGAIPWVVSGRRPDAALSPNWNRSVGDGGGGTRLAARETGDWPSRGDGVCPPTNGAVAAKPAAPTTAATA